MLSLKGDYMSNTTRIGIIGCGRIAEADHVPGYIGTDDCTISAICDIRKDRITGIREKFPVLNDAEEFSDANELFTSGMVDAVSICTPNDLHYPQTIAACNAGLHVLCEKPMAGNLAQTTEMIEAAKRAKVVLQINQSFRYLAQYQSIVDLVKGGAIGEPIHMRCMRAGDSTPNIGWSPGADWFVQKKHEGGLLVDIGIHMADYMRMVMGDADRVAGVVDSRLPHIDVSDNVNALFTYKNGSTGTLELSWTIPGGASFLEVYGTEGRIRLGFADEGVQLWQPGGDGEGTTSYPQAAPRKNSVGVYVDAVRGKGKTLTPGEYGRRALALCVAIQESHDAGSFVSVEHFDGEDDI